MKKKLWQYGVLVCILLLAVSLGSVYGAPKQVTLKFLFLNEWGTQTQGVNIPKQLEKFYQANPNIKVEIEMCPFAEYEKKILVSHAAGGGYDMFFVNNTSTTMLAKAGAIANLTPFVAKSKIINMKDYFNAFAGTCFVGKKQYALPFETDCRLMAYNKKMFKDAGIEVPKTVDQFMAAAKALTKEGNYGFVDVFSVNWAPIYDTGVLFFGDGGSFVKKSGGAFKASFNTPEGVSYLKRMKELTNYMPKDVFSYDYSKMYASFAQGKAAMAVYGPWIFSNQELADTKLDYGLALIPSGKVKSASTQGGWLISVSGDSKNKAAAFKVLEFLARPEVNASIVGGLSPMAAAYNYPPMNAEKYKLFAEQLKTATMVLPSGFDLAPQVADAFYAEFSKAVLTNVKAEDAAKSANDAIQKVINNNK